MAFRCLDRAGHIGVDVVLFVGIQLLPLHGAQHNTVKRMSVLAGSTITQADLVVNGLL